MSANPRTLETRRRWEIRAAIQRSTFVCSFTCVHDVDLLAYCADCPPEGVGPDQ